MVNAEVKKLVVDVCTEIIFLRLSVAQDNLSYIFCCEQIEFITKIFVS